MTSLPLLPRHPSLTKSCCQPPDQPTTCFTTSVVLKTFSCPCSCSLYPHPLDILQYFLTQQLLFFLPSQLRSTDRLVSRYHATLRLQRCPGYHVPLLTQGKFDNVSRLHLSCSPDFWLAKRSDPRYLTFESRPYYDVQKTCIPPLRAEMAPRHPKLHIQPTIRLEHHTTTHTSGAPRLTLGIASKT
jgi:hypothetical protein